MKKSIIFLFFYSLFINSFSQNNINPITPNQESGILTNFKNTEIGKHLKSNLNNKALGDTLHYEPFDSLPSGYTIVNYNAQNGVVWKWDTLSRISGFLTTIPRIKSTTGATGYMSLPMPSFITADTYFESYKITITPKVSVLLQYQIYIQTCCSSSDITIEVSTDSINWDSYDISFPNNTPNTDTSTAVTFESVNLSATLANQTDFWYRVSVSGPDSYFVMLDDFAFVEGPCNDLVLSNSNLEFNKTNYSYYPTYSQIPNEFFPALPFFANIKAEGGCDQTGVGFDVEVNHLNTPGGGSATGLGVVYTSLNNIGNLLSLSDTNVTSGTPLFTPSVLGDFEVEFKASSDSIDQVPSNNSDTWHFSLTDTVFAKDDNNYDGGVGPANYEVSATGIPGGTTVGDRFGTMYILENSCSGNGSQNIPTSVSYYVSSNSKNIGVEIVPKIWEYNEDSLTSGVNAAFGNEVASSFLNYSVTSSDTNSFLTIPFTSGTALINGLDSGQYVVGWEVTNLPTGKTFEVANDVSASLRQPPITSFLYFGHATSAGWGWVDAQPVIRLNMGNLRPCGVTSIIKSNASDSVHFAISPNPSSGEFILTITSEERATYNLNVRNMLGQMVYSTQVQVNGTKIERMNLTNFDKGVYFVSLESENEKLLKKVVLK